MARSTVAPLTLAVVATAAMSSGVVLVAGGSGDGVPVFVCFALALGCATAAARWSRPVLDEHLAFVVCAVAVVTPGLMALVRAGTSFTAAGIAVALATAVYLLATTGRSAEETRERRGVAVVALACATAVAARHLSVTSAIPTPDVVTLIVGIPLIALAYVTRSAWRRRLVILVPLAIYAFAGLALIAGMPYHSDSVVVVHHAADLLLAGRHPYADFDMREALASFALPEERGTQLEDGSLVRSFAYPALAFLSVAPFIAAGLGDVRWLYLAEVVVLFVVAMRLVAPQWRPLVLAAGVGNVVILRQAVLAGADPLWALLMLMAWAWRDRLRAAIPLGLAIAARQTAWFVAPFFIADTWRRHGGRRALTTSALAAAVSLLVNAPFFVSAPAAFAAGALAPLAEPLEPLGVGIVGLGTSGVLPLLPRAAYAVVAAAVFVALFALFIVRWPRWSRAALVLPLVAVFFAWRSLYSYFMFLPLFAIDDRERG